MKATGEFSGFYKLVKDGETDERLDTAADMLKELIGITNNGFNTINNTMTAGFNKLAHGQDRMLEKQDTGINILEKLHDDTSEIKSTLSRIEVDVKDTDVAFYLILKRNIRRWKER